MQRSRCRPVHSSTVYPQPSSCRASVGPGSVHAIYIRGLQARARSPPGWPLSCVAAIVVTRAPSPRTYSVAAHVAMRSVDVEARKTAQHCVVAALFLLCVKPEKRSCTHEHAASSKPAGSHAAPATTCHASINAQSHGVVRRALLRLERRPVVFIRRPVLQHQAVALLLPHLLDDRPLGVHILLRRAISTYRQPLQSERLGRCLLGLGDGLAVLIQLPETVCGRGSCGKDGRALAGRTHALLGAGPLARNLMLARPCSWRARTPYEYEQSRRGQSGGESGDADRAGARLGTGRGGDGTCAPRRSPPSSPCAWCRPPRSPRAASPSANPSRRVSDRRSHACSRTARGSGANRRRP